MKQKAKVFSTRTDFRPFTIKEQKRILLVGACLQCHKEDAKVMKNSLIDFEKVFKNLDEKCVLPHW